MKTKDGVIDNLLRAYVSRTNPDKACPEFDPDLANSYVERSLTPRFRAHYEVHLSECAECRKGVAVLVRLYDADHAVSAFPSRAKDRPTLFSGARQVFAVLSRPQWAIAAAAVIVLAISLPLLLSRNESRPSEQAADAIVAIEQPAGGTPSPSQPALVSPVASSKSAGANTSTSTSAPSKPGEKRESDALAISSPAAMPGAGVPGGAGGAAAQSQKPEAKSVPQTGDQVQVTAGQAFSQAPAQAGAGPGSQVAKKESDQQQGKDSAQKSADAKQDRADEPRDKEKTARAEEAPAPPAPASTSEAAGARGGSRRSPAKLALRDSATTESARPVEPQKKIGSKRFLLRDNTWTDKDFDPGKDLPVVTIIRDSNVYKEELAKRAGLKPYVEGFAAAERAIIVYKGTVYKLIPQ